jgi:hypothetical protein
VPDPLTLGLLIVAAVCLGVAAGAVALALHLRTRVYALEQLQGLTTRRIRVIADHVDIPLAVERRRRHGGPPGGRERRQPLTDGPVPEGLGGHPRIDLPASGPRLAGDERRLEEPVTGPQTVSGVSSAHPQTEQLPRLGPDGYPATGPIPSAPDRPGPVL